MVRPWNSASPDWASSAWKIDLPRWNHSAELSNCRNGLRSNAWLARRRGVGENSGNQTEEGLGTRSRRELPGPAGGGQWLRV